MIVSKLSKLISAFNVGCRGVPTGVSIGVGKKAATDSARRTFSYNAAQNFWWDQRNKYNLCVAGAIANWLHSEGLCSKASEMKNWAESQNLYSIDVDPMKKALDYIKYQAF